MVPDLEVVAKSNTLMEISVAKQNIGSDPEVPVNKLMHSENHVNDQPFHTRVLSHGKAKIRNEIEGVEVDITECMECEDNVLAEADFQDTTENSSSFSGTISGTENASTLNDVEVESPFRGWTTLASIGDEYTEAVPKRKKKLTDHWRRVIRPIMWRCKWIELQLKEMNSQARKYDIALTQFDQRKQVQLEICNLKGSDAISQSFSGLFKESQVMKRKKRNRVEEKTDLASYMAQHNLFSYYEHERPIATGAAMGNECGNLDNKIHDGADGFEFNEGWLSVEFRGGDNFLELMLLKIDVVQSQVRKLKDRIETVVSENPGKYTSINNLSLLVPCNGSTSSDQNIASSPERGDGIPDLCPSVSPPCVSECNMGDLFMPESAVSSHGEVTPIPDMSESTGLLLVGDACETKKEEMVIDNEQSDVAFQHFQRIISRVTARHHESLENLNSSPPAATPEPVLLTKLPRLLGQPSTSKSNMRNNKRKWGRGKSLAGKKWRRRSSG